MTPLCAVAADARLFDATSTPATVAYVSHSAVNLRGPENTWTMLCAARLGCGPRTVLIRPSGALDGIVSLGAAVTIGKSSVVGDAGPIVTWDNAIPWTPSHQVGSSAGIGSRLAVAAAIVGQLGCFLARPLISRPVRALRDSCIDLSTPGINHAVSELIGLGPGLTPAGDDYLSGYLAALRHLVADDPRASKAQELLAEAIHSTEPGSTHPLSEFLLGQYRAGVFPHFLTACLRALALPSTIQRLGACVRRVLRHGATSGTEMMLGVLGAGHDFLPESECWGHDTFDQ